jgi:osmotically inducible protein OsmC
VKKQERISGQLCINKIINKMKRSSKALWNGDLNTGHGELTTDSLILNMTPYSFNTRFGDVTGTNPEELLAAAHAGCFTMALTYALSQSGYKAGDLETTASVSADLAKGGITSIALTLNAAPIVGLSAAAFLEYATGAKQNCLLSKALSSVEISLNINYKELAAAS